MISFIDQYQLEQTIRGLSGPYGPNGPVQAGHRFFIFIFYFHLFLSRRPWLDWWIWSSRGNNLSSLSLKNGRLKKAISESL